MGTSRTNRAVMARETLAIIDAGGYNYPSTREWVPIGEDSEQAKRGTRLVFPETLNDQEDEAAPLSGFERLVSVANETTFSAGRRMSEGGTTVCCLNFASAKNPGGGFLNGSKAQEEDLAKSSALYPCLLEAGDYYKLNRSGSSSLYKDILIYSPNVPVFRDDDGELLEKAWSSSVITCPAPNAGAVRHNEPERAAEIDPVFLRRIEFVLDAARYFGEQRLVLGAWGCGVFQNDPAVCASLFEQALGLPRFHGRFSHVHFAVLDRSKELETFRAFESVFGTGGNDSV